MLVQSTLIISKSKGLSEVHRDISTSTYLICRTEEKIYQTTTFQKVTCKMTPEIRDIENIVEKEKLLLRSIFSFPQYFVTCC